MQLNPKLIKNKFKKSMDKYDENAVVQKLMAEKLAANLPEKSYRKILELGCGTGILTRNLVSKITYTKYFANDIVEKSKFYIDKIIPDNIFICGNAQKIKLPSKVDLIISNAMFQWFENLDKVLEYYGTLLNQGGTIAFSTFSPNNFLEIREITGLSLDYKTTDEIHRILERNFEIIYLENFDYKLNFANPLEILAHMKNTGVNSLTGKQWGITDVKIFCDEYKKKFPDLSLTYSPVIAVCKKL